MKILVVSLMVILAGALLPTQAGINFKLSQAVNNNILAALISFLVGTAGLALYYVLFHLKPLPTQSVASYPWWIWIGGLCGAFYVATTIIAAPRLGATVMFSFFLTGQMVASLILDHYGLIGFPVKELSEWRILGVVLVVSGALMIKYF